VAVCAIHGCLAMGTGKKAGPSAAVTVQAFCCLSLNIIRFFKCEDCPASTAFIQVFCGITVTVRAEIFDILSSFAPFFCLDFAVAHKFKISTDIIMAFSAYSVSHFLS
jgi:hypothetical protein